MSVKIDLTQIYCTKALKLTFSMYSKTDKKFILQRVKGSYCKNPCGKIYQDSIDFAAALGCFKPASACYLDFIVTVKLLSSKGLY